MPPAAECAPSKSAAALRHSAAASAQLCRSTFDPKQSGNPITVYVARVNEYFSATSTNPPGRHPGQLVTIKDQNALSEMISFQHTLDLGGNTANYEYDWRTVPPDNGLPPSGDKATWPKLAAGEIADLYTYVAAQDALRQAEAKAQGDAHPARPGRLAATRGGDRPGLPHPRRGVPIVPKREIGLPLMGSWLQCVRDALDSAALEALQAVHGAPSPQGP